MPSVRFLSLIGAIRATLFRNTNCTQFANFLKVSDRTVPNNLRMATAAPARQGLDYVHRTIREASLDGTLDPGRTMPRVMLPDELRPTSPAWRWALSTPESAPPTGSWTNRRVRVSE